MRSTMILRTGSSKPEGPGASAKACNSCCVSSPEVVGRDWAKQVAAIISRKTVQVFIDENGTQGSAQAQTSIRCDRYSVIWWLSLIGLSGQIPITKYPQKPSAFLCANLR